MPGKKGTHRPLAKLYVKMKEAAEYLSCPQTIPFIGVTSQRPSRRLPRETGTHVSPPFYEKANTREPATISPPPSTLLAVGFSPRNTTASKIASATLSLSIGATFEAGPSCSAR